jgi:hypothetical protein
MQKGRLRKTIVAVLLVGPILIAFNAQASHSVNIDGEDYDNYQIVDSNGQVYEITDTNIGNELAIKHIGEKVRVTGTIEKREAYQVIVVSALQSLME